MENIHTHDFRDTLSTSSIATGERIWIYPKLLKGVLYYWRMIVAYVLLCAFVIAPFLSLNGHPLFQFNIIERRFILFGVAFWPQDLPIFALLLIAFMVFVMLFTVIYGRLWCGWACPQTIWLEWVFRPIERLFEGDFTQKKKFDESPDTPRKWLTKAAKHFTFVGVSFATANVVLVYILGKHEWWRSITNGPLQHPYMFLVLVAFTAVFYFVFAKFRELACIIVCPYGRLQGVLLDKNSIVVAYDHVRGEPRGKLNTTNGDCVDCKLCVHVCPTGIDIRNGTQLECVNCTACIDACDNVMQKVNKPTGLIRYDSLNGILAGKRVLFTPRNIAYSAVLLALLALIAGILITRKPVQTHLLRAQGALPQVMHNKYRSYLFNVDILNKTFTKQTYRLKPVNANHRLQWVVGDYENGFSLAANSSTATSFFLWLPMEDNTADVSSVPIEVWLNGELLEVKQAKIKR